jgi:hypothetical protein
MVIKIVIAVLLFLIVDDLPGKRSFDAEQLFGSLKPMALEEPEAGKTATNLMNCGDYSGCTLVDDQGAFGSNNDPLFLQSGSDRTGSISLAVLHGVWNAPRHKTKH